MKEKIAYKLFSLRKDGTIGSLFINRPMRIPLNEWLIADFYPTKNYTPRKGWHCSHKKYAPHLSKRNRVWAKVKIKDYTVLDRPDYQGGKWFLANEMKVLEIGI